jgi:phosphoribosyl-AMP cyclohydrolase/phosphoribosyl-ATP pyrophosphohydrolase/phosphoribosyl-AMP cyclohydrolase
MVAERMTETGMYDMKKLFAKSDLIPAVVRDEATKDVLMLAYMNEESLQKTLETGRTWFYSRSRGRLWQKGETSGNVQDVVSVVPDCDDDALLVTVRQTGVACHTGNWSCFFAEPITGGQDDG